MHGQQPEIPVIPAQFHIDTASKISVVLGKQELPFFMDAPDNFRIHALTLDEEALHNERGH